MSKKIIIPNSKCEICGKMFYRRNGSYVGKHIYCSKNCCIQAKRYKITLTCETCGKTFQRVQSFVDKNKGNHYYCSVKCYSISKERKIPVTCIVCKKTFYVIPSRVLNNGNCCSRECSSINRKIKRLGENNPMWRGGLTLTNRNIRTSIEYAEWRNSVFKRDNYICKKCGYKGKNLNAHHIIPFSKDESLRFDVTNGITLCKKCHIKLHSKLRIENKIQLDLFNSDYEHKSKKRSGINVAVNV